MWDSAYAFSWTRKGSQITLLVSLLLTFLAFSIDSKFPEDPLGQTQFPETLTSTNLETVTILTRASSTMLKYFVIVSVVRL